MSLEVFADRLSRIKRETRNENSKIMSDIIKKTAGHLLRSSNPIIITGTISALTEVVSTVVPSEDVAIAGAVHNLINVISKLTDVFNLEALLVLLDLSM
jgi:sugar-specific transcriptional regulator TrmB